MLLEKDWDERFLRACATSQSARRRSFRFGQPVYARMTERRCWAVTSGNVKLLDPRVDGNRVIRVIPSRGNVSGDQPFGAKAFRGFASNRDERAVAHGPAKDFEFDRAELEIALRADAGFAAPLLESATTRA